MTHKTPEELKILGKIISKEPSVDIDSFGLDYESYNWKYYVIKDSVNNDYWTIRFPKDIFTKTNIEKEFNLLAKINLEFKTSGSHIESPNPKHIIDGDNDLKLLFYKKLSGFRATSQNFEDNSELLESAVRSIALIHNFNTSLLVDVGFEKITADKIKNNIQKTLNSIESSGHVSQRLINYFQKKYLGVKKYWKIKPTLIHGNLNPENFLIYNNDVLSIEDFSNTEIGDPAKDLKELVSVLSTESRSEILKIYKSINKNIDSSFEDRINFLIDFAWFEYLLFGINTDSKNVIDDALDVIAGIEDKIFEPDLTQN